MTRIKLGAFWTTEVAACKLTGVKFTLPDSGRLPAVWIENDRVHQTGAIEEIRLRCAQCSTVTRQSLWLGDGGQWSCHQQLSCLAVGMPSRTRAVAFPHCCPPPECVVGNSAGVRRIEIQVLVQQMRNKEPATSKTVLWTRCWLRSNGSVSYVEAFGSQVV